MHPYLERGRGILLLSKCDAERHVEISLAICFTSIADGKPANKDEEVV
jgi:hypothetical protein